MRAKALIYFQVYDTKRQYDELFPYLELEKMYQIVKAGVFNKQSNKIELSIELNLMTKKFHALLHNCMLMQRRYSSIMYLDRVRGYFPNRLEFKSIKFRNFQKRSLFERFIVLSFSNLVGITFLKFIVRLFFKLESLSKSKNLIDFSVFILPYTGGISAEWDFLVWYSRKRQIASVAIQENWDNLSSKQFLLGHPDRFLVWGKQSGSHLRALQNYTGNIVEVGCLRVQDFYNARNQENTGDLKKSNPNYILYVDSAVEQGDFHLLTLLSNFIATTSNAYFKNTFILYRTHPKVLNNLNRSHFLKKLQELPYVQIYHPSMNETNKQRVEQVVQSKGVISIFSTMLLESLIVFKKCIVPTFNLGFESYSQKNIIDDLTHFHGISLLDNLDVATSSEDFFNQLNQLEAIEIEKSCELKIFDWFCKNTNTRTMIIKNLNEIYDKL